MVSESIKNVIFYQINIVTCVLRVNVIFNEINIIVTCLTGQDQGSFEQKPLWPMLVRPACNIKLVGLLENIINDLFTGFCR